MDVDTQHGPADAPRRKKILYLVTEDWYFASHRLGLARLVRDAGFDVAVGTRLNRWRGALENEGFAVFDIPFERSLRYPWRDVAAVQVINRVIREHRPDVLHLVSMKPILLAGLVTRREAGPVAIAAFTGLGYLFTSRDTLARVVRPVVAAALKRIMQRTDHWALVQNEDDFSVLSRHGITQRSRARVIRGAGVDVAAFIPVEEEPGDQLTVLLPARLLVDKGVREFVAAAGRLRRAGAQARFVLVGAHDRDNPGAVGQAELDRWLQEGVVEWLGHRDDMPDVLRRAAVVCLPSYREGLPKSLLEGAACAKPLVATDVPGCREICIDGETGLSVPPHDANALAGAIGRLLDDAVLRRRLGTCARELVLRDFSLERIAQETLDLYTEILGTPAPESAAPATRS